MSQVTTREESAEHEEVLLFLWNVHAHIQQSIRFADSKAGIVLIVTASLVGALFAGGVLDAIFTFDEAVPVCAHLAGWVALLLLAAGWLLSAVVIYPRTPPGVPGRFVFWRDIRRFEDSTRMLESLQNAANRRTALGEQVYEVAGIADAKYWWLRPSMIAALAGIIVTGVALTMFRLV